MSISIIPSDSSAISTANFVSMLNNLSQSLNYCASWASQAIAQISQLQADSNYTKLISEDRQAIIASAQTQLREAQESIAVTLAPVSGSLAFPA